MARDEKTRGLIALIVQLVISFAYSAMLVHMTIILFSERTHGRLSYLIAYLPQLVIIIFSVILQIILRIRHRTHIQNGSLMPLLFSFIALEATYVIPLYNEVTGTTFLSPAIVVIVARFAIITTAAIFLFSAVQFFGTNNSRSMLYLALCIAAIAYLSIAAPISTDDFGTMLYSSAYDALLSIITFACYVAAALTYCFAVIKDRATHTPEYAVGFILLMIGNYLSLGTGFISGTFAIVLYITGVIVLSASSKQMF